MNYKKMIIRNCPAYNDMPNMYNEIYGYCDNEHDIDLDKCMCENINDCVVKRIVELLQQYDEEDCNWCEPISFNTENIYELLKIQEVE